MWIGILTAAAWACGGLVHADGVLAEGEGNQVLFELGTTEVTVTYEVAYAGDAPDFGWIVPIFGEFSGIDDADADMFEALAAPTGPRVATKSTPGCACPGASAGSVEDRGDNVVEVVAEGFTGTYDYAVVSAASAGDLQTWLDDNGWSMGALGEAVDHYVAEGADFVAIEVSPDAPATSGDVDLPPVSITYSGTDVVYPAQMLATSDASEQRTTIYVRADDRFRVSGWTADEIDGFTARDDDSPTEAWVRYRRNHGDDTSYVLTWAGFRPDGEPGFVTRFDTIAPPEAHTVDAVFTSAGNTDAHATTIIMNEDNQYAALFLPLLFLFGLRRRRAGG